MTTGRINQVTIVRRGRPTARIAGWQSSLVTVVGGAREAHREAAQLVRQVGLVGVGIVAQGRQGAFGCNQVLLQLLGW